MSSTPKMDISTSSIIRLIIVVLAFWLIYTILDILALLIISVILVSAMEPAVDFLQTKKIPRAAGVTLIYLLIVGIVASFIFFLASPLVNQIQSLSKELPSYWGRFENSFLPVKEFFASNNVQIETKDILGNIGQGITSATGNIFSTTVGVFSGVVSVIVVLSLAFYMSVEENSIAVFLVSITPEKHKRYVESISNRIKDSMGKWMLGQLLLMVIIAILDSIGLSLIGVPHALLLGIFAGIMEIVPYVGPIIGAVPGVILGFIASPVIGFASILLYVLVQQLENHVIVPQVMKKAVGLNPITVILVLLIGAKLAGVMGAILAVPVAAAVSIFVKDWKSGRGM